MVCKSCSVGSAAVTAAVIAWRSGPARCRPFRRRSSSTLSGRPGRRRTRSSAGRLSSNGWSWVPTRLRGVPRGGWVSECRNCVPAVWRPDVHLRGRSEKKNDFYYNLPRTWQYVIYFILFQARRVGDTRGLRENGTRVPVWG